MDLTEASLLAGIAEIGELIGALERVDLYTIPNRQCAAIGSLEQLIETAIRRIFGSSEYHQQFARAADLSFVEVSPWLADGARRTEEERRALDYALRKSSNTLRAAQDVLRELRDSHAESERATMMADATSKRPSRRVFVVHGHDEGAREAVARFLEKIEVSPVILHEQANRGLTIIEKIERNNDVNFAVVILSPDDEGRKKGSTELIPRARQNVLLELGYFIGRLGRQNVCAFKRGEVEIPTDFAGVVWTPFDGEGWKLSLCKELAAVGMMIDFNKAFA